MLSPSTILSFCAVVAIIISRTFALEETCSDSRARYFLQGPKGTGPALTCKNVDSQCKPKDRSHCPNSCGVCDEYGCSDSLYAFKVGSKRTKCNKIAELSPQKIKKKCMKSLIYYTCRATCGLCDTKSTKPPKETKAPKPTKAPKETKAPKSTKAPKTGTPGTAAPTVTPTVTPTVPPTADPCSALTPDVPSAQFFFTQNNGNGNTKTCSWLEDENESRKIKICEQTANGPLGTEPAQKVCEYTCNFCI